MEYAQLRMQHPTKKDRIIRKPAVIGAIIDLGYCLDLLDSRYFGMIREGHRLLEDFFAQLSVPMPVNRSRSGETELILRHLDCAVINMMHRTRAKKNEPPFDTVRAAFIEGEPLFQGSSFNDKNHIQICVCNLRCVRGYFRPRPDDESVNAVPPQPMS